MSLIRGDGTFFDDECLDLKRCFVRNRSGYVIVRAKSNKTQKIKIPFYGTIKM